MEYVFLNDLWPFRVETTSPDMAPITVDGAFITVTRLDDMVIMVPTTPLAPWNIHSGYVEYTVSPPTTSVEGNYVIDWDIALGINRQSYRTFFAVISIPEYSAIERALIEALSIRLKDNRPELYRVDIQEAKWHMEELYSFLYYALLDVNGGPPFWTDYTFDTLPSQLHGLLLLAAQITAIIAEATLQAANDFSYNDNGLTVTLSRSGKYMQIASMLWQQYSMMLAKVKRMLGFKLTQWVGVKVERAPISVRRPLSMLPHLETIFGRSGGEAP